MSSKPMSQHVKEMELSGDKQSAASAINNSDVDDSEVNDELVKGCAEELMQAYEQKDKAQFLESLRALILNVE